MSHHVYTTDGIIIHSSPYKEGDRLFTLFTRDLGLVVASASGIRYLKSKLRYHVKDYNFANFSLVKGKEMWRITGVREYNGALGFRKEFKIVFIKILSLVRRLVYGEEKNEVLFSIIENLYKFTSEEDLNADNISNIESLTVLRILNNLGYVQNSPLFQDILSVDIVSRDYLEKVNINRNFIIENINKALKESQL